MKKLTFERLEQRYRELQNRSFSDPLPQSATDWKRLVQQRKLDQLPVAVGILDYDYRLQEGNRSYMESLHEHSPFSPDEAIGKSIFEYLPGIQESGAGYLLKATREEGTTTIDIEREIQIILNNSRKKTIFDANLIALLDRRRHVVGIVIFCLDITHNGSAINICLEQQQKIEELKTALRAVTELRVEDRKQLVNDLFYNTNQMVMPLLERLKSTTLNSEQESLVQMLESSMNQVTSGFSSRLSSPDFNLTQREVFIAGMIREGRSTKEIADILVVAETTVNFHRNSIRKKLGINNSATNLRSYLMSIT